VPEKITFVELLEDSERGLWRSSCTCQACAHFLCPKCGAEWLSRPGVVSCIRCKHIYVQWVNYAKRRKTHSRR